MKQLYHTMGVYQFIEKNNARWLIDLIMSCRDNFISRNLDVDFIVIRIYNNSVEIPEISFDDGNGNIYATIRIDHTLPDTKLYFEYNTIMFPDER